MRDEAWAVSRKLDRSPSSHNSGPDSCRAHVRSVRSEARLADARMGGPGVVILVVVINRVKSCSLKKR